MTNVAVVQVEIAASSAPVDGVVVGWPNIVPMPVPMIVIVVVAVCVTMFRASEDLCADMRVSFQRVQRLAKQRKNAVKDGKNSGGQTMTKLCHNERFRKRLQRTET
jgi:hypothetical protein